MLKHIHMDTLYRIKMSTQEIEDRDSGDLDPFTLKGGHVKKMIEMAKVPSPDDPDDQPEEYSVYGSPYRDNSSDARRVSAMLTVRY